MDLSALFNNLLSEENTAWREKLMRETEMLEKKQLKLDNNDIQAKLVEVLRSASALLTKFTERVLGRDRAAVFERETEEINAIAAMQKAFQQSGDQLQRRRETLADAKNRLEELKMKMK